MSKFVAVPKNSNEEPLYFDNIEEFYDKFPIVTRFWAVNNCYRIFTTDNNGNIILYNDILDIAA